MIKTLTQAQIDKFPEYVERYVKIGLDTERVSFNTAKGCADYYYEAMLKKHSVPTVVLRSPIEAWIAVCMFAQVDPQVLQQVHRQVGQQVRRQVRQQVDRQVRQQVDPQVLQQVSQLVCQQVEQQVEQQVQQQVLQQVLQQVRQQVCQQVEQQVDPQVSQQVDPQVRQQVGQLVSQQVLQQVRQQVDRQVRQQINHFIWPYIDGSYWANYFSFYEFMRVELGIKYQNMEKYNWLRRTLEIGLFYPLENICIISDKPSAIKRNNNGLHCESDKALEYPDGWGFYALNGIVVPEWIVKTKSEEITVEQMLKVDNVDVRREVVRKMGVGRLISQGKEIDKSGDYILIDLGALFSRSMSFYAPYLVMKNPSVNIWHCEGVSENCRTVEQALNWRNGTNKPVLVLT